MAKSSGSSARDPRAAANARATGRRRKIDFSDIPELSDAELRGMKRVGRPPIGDAPRKAISIRLDQQVLEWLQQRAARTGQPYQSLINDILIKAMQRAR